ncbi:2759_t:CDS:1 [Funneliformis geosporum]|uniref:13962_t:CDS:1 n=1 Tax=Funneliformis geosporum TaxID=1117311 RepID=A0A9W4SUD6_9GLOM|nr:2759_t:CDS:1 [Funneliformis geosporum]CAI2181245.1 13962_t:CDS:1 [Funneliformis geosporum]
MDIYDGVLDWVIFNDKTHGEPEEIPAKEDQVFSIMLSKEILKMILNNSPGLEYLKIDVSRELKRRTRCESIPFPFLSADHNAGLPKLNTLHCSNDNANNEILLSLAKSTTSIKNLIINENDWDYGDIGTVNSAITKLVNAQKGIEKVIIKRVSRGVTDILLSLYSQKKTLKGIQLDHVSFGNDEQDLKCISEFSENLEEIRFINCYNLTDNVVRPLLNMEFPRLTTLEINNRHFYLLPEKCPTKEILELIKNLGNHLTELIVNASYQLTLYDSIFHHIQKYCGNLTTLGLSIGYKQLPHLLELFKSLKNLQRFIVQSDGGLCYIDNWLKVIAEGIPLTITSLEVNGWIMSPDGLKGFLNFSKNKIKVLEWRLPFGNKFEDYSSIIEDYSSNIYFVQISQRKLKEQIWDEARVEFV